MTRTNLATVLSALSAAATVVAMESTHATPVWKVPSFSVQELKSGSRSEELQAILSTTGLFSIQLQEHTHSPSWFASSTATNIHRMVAMDGLCQCLDHYDDKDSLGVIDGIDSVLLQNDPSTTRTTVATATVGKTPLDLPQELEDLCGTNVKTSMETLRDVVAMASDTFVQTLDGLLYESIPFRNLLLKDPAILRDNKGFDYTTLESVIQSANHLEHFHRYSKMTTTQQENGNNNHNGSKKTLEWHTDAGLFLAFLPAFDCHAAQPDTSFWIRHPDTNQPIQAEFPSGGVAIMMGEGAQHWLDTSDANISIKATVHAVQMQAGDARTWYGMMHLVPESAIIQSNPDKTFGDMKRSMVLSSAHRHEYGDDDTVAIGCGAAPVVEERHDATARKSDALISSSILRRRAQHVQDASACNNSTNFFCWMQCLDIPNANQAQGYINEGYSLYCLDPGELARSGNKVSKAVEPCDGGWNHNSNCMGSWQPTALGVPSIDVETNHSASALSSDGDRPFCYGGTSMYMDGFHWIHDTTCVIYLVPQWVLSTHGQLVGASFGTIVFGALLEYVIYQRRQSMTKFAAGYRRLAASAAFYGVQLTMGYLLMLVVMTYSGPLFMSVVLGIVFGHVLFNARDALLISSSTSSSSTKPKPKEGGEEASTDDEPIQEISSREYRQSCCKTDEMKNEKVEEEEDNQGVPEGCTPCCQNTL